ncbi:MAG: PDZ domain-containing protein [Clostridiales bacterium]|nr:PDZ domain-containing protein [Clostridiales bacterium]
MFGIFNMTRDDTEKQSAHNNARLDSRVNSSTKNSDEPCFGGFRSRWSYDDCRRRLSHPRIRVASPIYAAVGIISFAFCGLFLLACIILLNDFVHQNRDLYYPAGLRLSSDEISETESVAMVDYSAVIKQPDTSEYGTPADAIYENVTYELSKRYCIPRGVMISGSLKNSDAAIAGFIEGDIIVAVNGSEILSIDDLTILSDSFENGDIITFRIFRKNKYIDVAIANAPAS